MKRTAYSYRSLLGYFFVVEQSDDYASWPHNRMQVSSLLGRCFSNFMNTCLSQPSIPNISFSQSPSRSVKAHLLALSKSYWRMLPR